MNPRVLLLDGEQRSALAVVRSLGRAGFPVHVAAASTRSLAGASRWAASRHLIPSPLAGAGAYGQAVARCASEVRADWVLPVTDESISALVQTPAALPCRLLAPTPEQWAGISDKGRLLATAERIGVRVPRQRALEHPDAAAEVAAGLEWPVVLKPHRSVVEGGTGALRLTVKYADSLPKLEEIARGLPPGAFPLLLQERIAGDGVGVFLLRWGGRTQAAFAHRRLREKPPTGGVSVYRESIALREAPLEASERLLEAVGWEGVAMVEYKVSRATGLPYLMEINGRFWGSLQLAIDAGVDFPQLLLRHAIGNPPAPAGAYRLGIRSRWELGDLDHLLARLRRSDEELGLVPGVDLPRARAIAACLLPWRPGDRLEVFRFSDPRPFMTEVGRWLRRQ